MAKLQRRISIAIANGDARKARHLQRILLKSESTKIAATLSVNMRSRAGRRLKGSAILGVAREHSVTGISNEPALLLSKSRGLREPRIYRSYGRYDRVSQQMARIALTPFADIDARQFLLVGRDAAIDAISAHIDAGCRWAIEVDIQDYFGSLDRERIRSLLPIDRTVSSRAILSEDVTDIYTPCHGPYGGTTLAYAVTSRRGLPQGAHSSALVSEIVTNEIMKRLPSATVNVVNYGDNFFLLGRTRAATIEAFKTLLAAFGSAQVGTLAVGKCSGPRRICDGIDMLGYRIKTRNRLLMFKPTADNRRRMLGKLAYFVRRAIAGRLDRREFRTWLASWAASFSRSPWILLSIKYDLRPHPAISPFALAQLRKVIDNMLV